MIRLPEPQLRLTPTRTAIVRILLQIGLVGVMTVEDIALVVMFGLHTEGVIGMDVMLTRPRIGYMSIVHVDVPVILAIAVVILILGVE